MIGGIVGKLVRVDLSRHAVTTDEYSEEWLRKYVGGDGLAARILYDEMPPGISPLDPDSLLVVSAGPLAGTKVQAACGTSVAAVSPLSGFIYNGHASGTFAPQLKFSGHDAIVISGMSEKPVYLWIHDGEVEIREASSLWGKDTLETDKSLKQQLQNDKLSTLCIGPAGENRVRIACIVNDETHVIGRGGLGAVMGSKNLKAIAVYGKGKVPIADKEKFQELSAKWRKINMENPTVQDLHKRGTLRVWNACYLMGDVPIKNFSTGVIEGWENLAPDNYISNMFKRHTTCWGCTVAHGKRLILKGGIYEGREVEYPEYETTAAWGTNIGVTDPTVAAVGQEICDRYGLDCLGTSQAVSLAMECYERGLISTEKTDGLELNFGNYKAAFELVGKIAHREGFGKILAEGPALAAEYIGGESSNFITCIKNMPIPMHDFRAFWGYALQYAIGSAGPAHEGGPISAEMNGTLPRFSVDGKANAVIDGQALRCFANTLGICWYGAVGVSQDMITDTLSAATGIRYTREDLRTIGLRLVNLRRAYNIRRGLTPKDDTLSPRLLEAPPAGGAKGSKVNIKAMVSEYYELMGWDSKTGKPYRRTLEKLGLADIAEDLWSSK